MDMVSWVLGYEEGSASGAVETETRTVAADFSGGDMTIAPSSDGKVMTEVVVTKPETLLPENIAEGVDIAGIIGTLAASAGGEDVAYKIASNTGTYTGAAYGTAMVMVASASVTIPADAKILLVLTGGASKASTSNSAYSQFAPVPIYFSELKSYTPVLDEANNKVTISYKFQPYKMANEYNAATAILIVIYTV